MFLEIVQTTFRRALCEEIIVTIRMFFYALGLAYLASGASSEPDLLTKCKFSSFRLPFEPEGNVGRGASHVRSIRAVSRQPQGTTSGRPMPTCVDIDSCFSSPVGSTFKTLLSISVFETEEYVSHLLRNALDFTQNSTLIVVHVNKNTPDYSMSSPLWDSLRVKINCLPRVAVKGWSGTILQSQLSNVEFAVRCFGATGLRSVVFASSDMIWVRRGMEDYVAHHVASVPLLEGPEDCDNLEAHCPGGRRRMDATQCRVVRGHGSGGSGSGPDPCFVPPFKGLQFLVQRKHEGSFYPIDQVIRAMDELVLVMSNPILLEQRIAETSHLCPNPESAQLNSKNLFQTPHPLEEIFLQSWVSDSALNKGPPGSGDVLGASSFARVGLETCHHHESERAACQQRNACMLQRQIQGAPSLFAVKISGFHSTLSLVENLGSLPEAANFPVSSTQSPDSP